MIGSLICSNECTLYCSAHSCATRRRGHLARVREHAGKHGRRPHRHQRAYRGGAWARSHAALVHSARCVVEQGGVAPAQSSWHQRRADCCMHRKRRDGGAGASPRSHAAHSAQRPLCVAEQGGVTQAESSACQRRHGGRARAQRLCAGCGCFQPAREQRHDQPRYHHRVHDTHQREHVHVRCHRRARFVRHAGQLLNR